ncbi:MAG: cupin domain-containing protein [Pseudolabrys sp.]|nr:cupin domain-containing protein [Pseudolabrys sp.]
MYKLEPAKRLLEKATGIGVPDKRRALSRVRSTKPTKITFKPDGYVPNNARVPLLLYRKAVVLDGDPAALLEAIFNANGWGEAWRNGIYDFVHYHPRIYEVLGVARGSATLRLGGNQGRTIKLKAGDVLVVPPGVGHECLEASPTFLAVGAYPPTGTYSECRGSYQEYLKTCALVRRVRPPTTDPLFG